MASRGKASRAELLRVNDSVWCAYRYALANVLFVRAGDSVVVIDTAGSIPAARAALADFREECTLPVSHLIYTHFHGDHIGGARVFQRPTTRVVAQRRLPEELAGKTRVGTYRERVRALQFGADLHGPGQAARRAVTDLHEPEGGYVPPDTLFDEEHELRVDDLTFGLFHAEGESLDHAVTWVPETRTVFPGDLFYASFPMLSNPMKPPRPVLAWAEALDRMRALRPEHLVPSHGRPVSGAEEVRAVLGNYSRAIRHVHDATVNRINHGISLEQIREEVVLPVDLARLPYLQERYGRVAWAVTGIYRHYTGWYDFHPAELDPAPVAQVHRAVLEACEGPARLVERARRALREDDPRLALELTEIVLTIHPRNHDAGDIQRDALRVLAAVSGNRVARRIYAAAVKGVRGREADPAATFAVRRKAGYAGVWVRSPGEAASHGTVERGESRQSDRRTDHVIRDEGFGFWTPGTCSPKQARATLLDVLLAFIPRKTGTILDAGCGTGGTCRHLLNYYAPDQITGVDCSAERLRGCCRDIPSCRFLSMHLTDLAFCDDSFDNVICVEQLHRLPGRAAVLREAHRVLRPGGRLVVADVLLGRRRDGTWPEGAPLADASQYREQYFDAGFDYVEIVDATGECMEARPWRAPQAQERYYVLACAQKAVTEPR